MVYLKHINFSVPVLFAQTSFFGK